MSWVERAHGAWALVLCVSACADEPRQPTPRTQDATPVAEARDAGAPPDAPPSTSGPLDAASPLLDAGPGRAADAGSESLIDHALWKPTTAELDPFGDAPADARCSGGVMPELLADERVFSIDTGLCNYLTVTQPSARGIAAGERIKVRLWHFALSAPAPAEAHAAVFVDGLAVLDERVPIPAAGGLLTRELRVERAVPRGAPVHFHLHNHGTNSWSLVEVSVAD